MKKLNLMAFLLIGSISVGLQARNLKIILYNLAMTNLTWNENNHTGTIGAGQTKTVMEGEEDPNKLPNTFTVTRGKNTIDILPKIKTTYRTLTQMSAINAVAYIIIDKDNKISIKQEEVKDQSQQDQGGTRWQGQTPQQQPDQPKVPTRQIVKVVVLVLNNKYETPVIVTVNGNRTYTVPSGAAQALGKISPKEIFSLSIKTNRAGALEKNLGSYLKDIQTQYPSYIPHSGIAYLNIEPAKGLTWNIGTSYAKASN